MPRPVKWGHVPDNLPVAPDGAPIPPEATDAQLAITRPVVVGDFVLTLDDVQRLRQALAADLGGEVTWTDAEICEMSLNALRLMDILATFKEGHSPN